PVRPLAQSNGHDAPGLIDQLVASVAAMVDEIVVGFEDSVREPVVAHELPDIFDRIELGAFWRQRNDGDVCRHDEAGAKSASQRAAALPSLGQIAPKM